jgi:UDP-3-O-[3-hydroxymyristoyl] glucosamine N-acyltransferase
VSNSLSNVSYDLATLATLLDAELDGDPDTKIYSLATLKNAKTGELSFYHNPRYYSDLCKTQASAVILPKSQADNYSGNKLLSDNPYICYARSSHLFKPQNAQEKSIAATASIHASVSLGDDVVIGENVVIAENVIIEGSVSIAANTVIGAGTQIGEASQIDANVSIAHDVEIGKRAHIYSGVVIGSDGFGFAEDKGKYLKIAQLGRVIIGDDVEIGANTCIDRGALDNTVIGNGVKIDNQVQIAHNVEIGDNTVICGCSAMAGSVKIGKHCVIAGGVGIINHVEIADGVTVTAMSLVNQSIREAGSYSSGTGLSKTADWKKNIVHFRQLDKLIKRFKNVNKKGSK